MLNELDLRQFTGTEHYYKHWTGKLVYTDGVKYLADHGGAWIIDAVASYQSPKYLGQDPGLREFQLWELVRCDISNGATRTYVLILRADSGPKCKPIVHQRITYTDFPLDYLKLYVEGGVVLLPNEH